MQFYISHSAQKGLVLGARWQAWPHSFPCRAQHSLDRSQLQQPETGCNCQKKSISFTLSNLSPAYCFLHQKKKKSRTKQTLSDTWLSVVFIFFFLDNFSFCICHLKEKYMCQMHTDQNFGACLYLIQEIKGWRNFIPIWGQQNKVTKEQHVCLSAIHSKAVFGCYRAGRTKKQHRSSSMQDLHGYIL